MIAKELISNELAALMTSDSGEEALTMMSIFHVKHLPIVNNEVLLGIISEDDLYSNDVDESIGSYQLSLSKAMVYDTDHLFEVMAKMASFKLTIVPVIDHQERYLGLITQEDLLQYYATSFSFSEPGSIIVLETTKPNYSLSEVSRIVEGENATILASFITAEEYSNNILVTIKINKPEIQAIVASLHRFEYTVKASFSELEYVDTLKENYDALMSYLNV